MVHDKLCFTDFSPFAFVFYFLFLFLCGGWKAGLLGKGGTFYYLQHEA